MNRELVQVHIETQNPANFYRMRVNGFRSVLQLLQFQELNEESRAKLIEAALKDDADLEALWHELGGREIEAKGR